MKYNLVACLLTGYGFSTLSGSATAQQAVAVEVSHATTAADSMLAHPVTVHLSRVSLRQAVDAVAESAGIQVLYRHSLLDTRSAFINVHASRTPASAVLAQVLAGTHLQVIPVDGGMFSIVPVTATASRVAEGTIAGRIINAQTKQPVRGASVSIDGAGKGVVTGDDGTYRLPSVPAGRHTMTVKYLGYSRQTRTVIVNDNQVVTCDVALEASATALDQVVVTGMVIPTELKAIPNAITVITAKDIEQRGITHIDQLFRGDVPGLFALKPSSGYRLGEVMLYSRGMTEMNENYPAQGLKTYVDGIELADPKYLSQLDPKSIERIEILTGPQASTIYGSKAINGVMQVFTKRGTTAYPQVTLTLQSGFVESQFSSALTPQHNDAAQVSGVSGDMSYAAGGSWVSVGRWTPSVQSAQTDGFGGLRFTHGPITVDGKLRLATTMNHSLSSTGSGQATALHANGFFVRNQIYGTARSAVQSLVGNTLGVDLTYAFTPWWSHEVGVGADAATTQTTVGPRYWFASDTLGFYSQSQNPRRSMHYTTTLRTPLTPAMQTTITAGADGWNTSNTAANGSPIKGGYTNSQFQRQVDHNRGMFVQGQVGFGEAAFLTYGLRAEWNPNYGANAEPNYAPRYGMAYTTTIGSLTAKWRASYGRSTRPPIQGEKLGQKASEFNSSFYTTYIIPLYGNFYRNLPNPGLGPEYQQGTEGGVELYFGSRASLVVTRYNQTVDNLIYGVSPADSVRSFQPLTTTDSLNGSYWHVGSQGYGYYIQDENLNVGSIRNQGWELQGTMTAGPLTTKGTYSWTKSRFLGVTPQARAAFGTDTYYNQFRPGATFNFVPEHTWAVTTSYTQRSTTVALTVNGIGVHSNWSAYTYGFVSTTSARLQQNQLRTYFDCDYFCRYPTGGYTTADLNASQQITPRVQGLVTVKNLTNDYHEDSGNDVAVLGRQTLFGLRIIW